MQILKPFDLDAAKQGAKLVTDNGNPARIICWDCKYEDYALVALVLINGKECPMMFMKNGISYKANSFQRKLQIVEEIEISDRWRDQKEGSIEGFKLCGDSILKTIKLRESYGWKSLFSTEQAAKSAQAAAQITQIIEHDKRFGGKVTEKELQASAYRPAIVRGLEIDKSPIVYVRDIDPKNEWYLLTFHTRAQADLFLAENQDLINKYYML